MIELGRLLDKDQSLNILRDRVLALSERARQRLLQELNAGASLQLFACHMENCPRTDVALAGPRGRRRVVRILVRGAGPAPPMDERLTNEERIAIAKRQMAGGGTVVTFELDAPQDRAKERAFEVLDKVQIIDISNNLGDSKSLITHPATTTHRAMGPEGRAAIGLGDGVVRVSVGLEGTEDLIADLDRALA